MKNVSDRISKMISIYQNMVNEVDQLEKLFPGRRFTLDGHLIGSIGEAIAEDCYGIVLEKPSYKDFDGTYEGKPVQIKTVQQDKVLLRCDEMNLSQDACLLVLYLNKSGRYYEVYNGSFTTVWKLVAPKDKRGYKHISINRLMALSSDVTKTIKSKSSIEFMRLEYKNVK